MHRLSMFLVSIALALALAPVARGVYPIPPLQTPPMTTYPCSSSTACHDCSNYGAWNRDTVYQVSLANHAGAYSPDGSGTCGSGGSYYYCSEAPVLDAATAAIGRTTAGLPAVVFTADYTMPSIFCQYWSDASCAGPDQWPVMPPFGTLGGIARLVVSNGTDDLLDVPALFERGVWKAALPIGTCDGQVHTFTVVARKLCGGPPPSYWQESAIQVQVTYPSASAPECRLPDPSPCPGCNP